MPFTIACPSCKARMRAPDKLSPGQALRCPVCKAAVPAAVVNAARPKPSPPAGSAKAEPVHRARILDEDDDVSDAVLVGDEEKPAPARRGGGIQARPGTPPPAAPARARRTNRDDDEVDDEAEDRDRQVKKRRSGLPFALLVFGGIAAVLLLCGGGVVLLVLAFRSAVSSGPLAALNPPASVDDALAGLRSGDTTRKNLAVAWLQQAPPDPQRGAEVAKALEPLLDDADGFLRDPAAGALGRWAVQENVPLLVRMLNSDSGATREAAMDGLARLKDPRGTAALAERMGNIFDRAHAGQALQAVGPPAEKDVVRFYFDRDGGTRDEARRLLASYRTRDAVILDQAVADLQGGDGERQKVVAEWLLTRQPDDQHRAAIAQALEAALTSPNVFARELAGKALAAWATRENVPTLLQALDSDNGQVRTEALNALVRLKDERAIPAIAARLAKPFEEQQAAAALAAFGPAAEQEVAKYHNHPNPPTRDQARKLLKGYGTKDAVILGQAVTDLGDAERRRAALDWLAERTADEEHRAAVGRAVEPLLKEQDDQTSEAALKAMKKGWATKENVEGLLALVVNPPFTPHGNFMCDTAMEVLGKIKDERAVPAVAAQLPNIFHRDAARKALEAMGSVAEKETSKYLLHQDAGVRALTWKIFAVIGSKENLPALQKIAKAEPDRSVALEAANALLAIKAKS
jgi:HEAT repeat protein